MNTDLTSFDLESYLQKYTNRDGLQLYNLIENVTVDVNTINQGLFDYHFVSPVDAWTTISYKYYNTIALWWLLVKCNKDIIDTPLDMPATGSKIRIPKPLLVQQILSALNTL